jgi:hypothetical protein
MNFINILRNGIYSSELPMENIRLNGFVATFLARTTFIMTQPLNPLYSTLQTFLMAKPILDLNTIPELLQLYYSSEIEYRAHRHWILEVISDGLKSDHDMDVALKCVLFKMLFDFYTCVLSDILSKVRIFYLNLLIINEIINNYKYSNFVFSESYFTNCKVCDKILQTMYDTCKWICTATMVNHCYRES